MSVAPTGADAMAAVNPAVESSAPVASTAYRGAATSIAMGSVMAWIEESSVSSSVTSALGRFPEASAIDGAPQAAAVRTFRREKVPMIPPDA
ncbi:hypothetical protein [Microbacterium sp. Bi128]|uniref:hypothetical protein n=1 Tax=Microbacterium sp. Bi128 TaxID=2821115 RepID=UPI001E2D6AE4|nr:hypothetical protein [Microbacterium sp. Bi128]